MYIFTSLAILLLASVACGNPVVSPSGGHARQFNLRTAFTKITFNTDSAIYVTPELLFVGKKNGDILRCLFREPSVCETFYSYGSSTEVTSTVASGEYLYASLANGVMLRCHLYQKNSCSTFNTFSSSVNCLAVSAGYIHAGLSGGQMMRCDLEQPNKCTTLNTFASKVTSLGATDEYIYAGLDSAEIWRCLMSSENSCRLIYTAGRKIIQGMTAIEDTVISVTENGYSWNCTRDQKCFTKYLPGGGYTSTAVFNGSLYVMRYSNVSICHWGTGPHDCAHYEYYDGALSMSFAYSAYKMQDRFVNEEKTCLPNARCPPFMVYYKLDERPMLEVFVKGGKLYNSVGVLVDTRDADVVQSGRAAIFAMGADGQILLSKVHNSVLRSSSLFAGQPVAGAGEMVVDNGVIKSVRACSDHYRPTVELNRQVIDALRLKGYTGRIDNLPCCQHNKCAQGNVDEHTPSVESLETTDAPSRASCAGRSYH